jgi:DMSO reductase anchor subunit
MTWPEQKLVANLEEIQPRSQSNWDELPLMLFTLLTQVAVGGFWAMSVMFPFLWSAMDYDSIWLRLFPSIWVGASLGAGMLASFAHLGTKRNAWRVLRNIRKSSLSREILFTGLFGVSWLITAIENVIRHQNSFEGTAITAILGIGLVYNMSQVYRFPAAPSWNTWRTTISFILSTLLLGTTSMASVLAYESSLSNIQIPQMLWTWIGGSTAALLVAQWSIIDKSSQSPLRSARTAFILAGVVLCLSAVTLLSLHGLAINILLFLIVATEETIGRWLFYKAQPSIVKH